MKRRNKLALGLIGVLVIGLLALQTPLLRHVRGATWRTWLNVVTFVFPVGQIHIDNDVTAQIERLTSENVRYQAQQRDYVRLREQLGSPVLDSYRFIQAEVAARPLDTFGVSFRINRGVRDGVTLHAPVVIYGSTLIGFVSELNASTAVVQLLLHPSTNLPVEIESENSPKGLLVGRQYTSLAATTIPRDAAIKEGQNVVTVAGENVPYGLRVGTIGVSVRQENLAYQEASLVLPYDPDQLRAVTVVVAP